MGVWDITGASADGSGNLTLTGAINAASAAITGALTSASMTLTGAITAASAAISGLVGLTPQTIAMAGNNKTLIMTGSPGANEVLVTSNVIAMTATGATRTMTLPSASAANGKPLLFLNAGAIDIIVTDGTTATTVTGGKGLICVSNGSGFGRLTGA